MKQGEKVRQRDKKKKIRNASPKFGILSSATMNTGLTMDNASAASPEAKSPYTATAQCACKAVEYAISCTPEQTSIRSYCTCLGCRTAHSAPIYQVVYVTNEYFHLLKGQDVIGEFPMSNVSGVRCFCKTCGTCSSSDFGA